jgi:hypothetical protein
LAAQADRHNGVRPRIRPDRQAENLVAQRHEHAAMDHAGVIGVLGSGHEGESRRQKLAFVDIERSDMSTEAAVIAIVELVIFRGHGFRHDCFSPLDISIVSTAFPMALRSRKSAVASTTCASGESRSIVAESFPSS